MTDSTTFVPMRRLISDPGYVPASPFICTDASRNYNRWSAYWLQPRTTLGPWQVGLHGLNGPFEAIQSHTQGYGIPVILGASIGYLTEKKTGAIAGAIIGALAKWGWDRWGAPWLGAARALTSSLTPPGVSGFMDEFQWNPEMGAADSTMDRSAYRTLQIIMVVGIATLGLKLAKVYKRGGLTKNRSRRRRNGRTALPRWNDKRGWTGGDTRTLYAFTDKRTGRVVVYPGGSVSRGVGPEMTVRVATRAEAQQRWQDPLNPGWKVEG